MLTAFAFAPDYLTLRAARILLKAGGFRAVQGIHQSSGMPTLLIPEKFDFLLIGYEFSATGEVINAAKIHHLLEVVYPDSPAILWSHGSWEEIGTACRWRRLTIRLDALATVTQLVETVDALMCRVSSSQRQTLFNDASVAVNLSAKSEKGILQPEIIRFQGYGVSRYGIKPINCSRYSGGRPPLIL